MSKSIVVFFAFAMFFSSAYAQSPNFPADFCDDPMEIDLTFQGITVATAYACAIPSTASCDIFIVPAEGCQFNFDDVDVNEVFPNLANFGTLEVKGLPGDLNGNLRATAAFTTADLFAAFDMVPNDEKPGIFRGCGFSPTSSLDSQLASASPSSIDCLIASFMAYYNIELQDFLIADGSRKPGRDIPLDGGLSFLLLSGLSFGLYKKFKK